MAADTSEKSLGRFVCEVLTGDDRHLRTRFRTADLHGADRASLRPTEGAQREDDTHRI